MSSTNRGTIRKVNDFYSTPSYTIESLLNAHTELRYPILEPCVGEGAIWKYLGDVTTNDIDEGFLADYHVDYTNCDMFSGVFETIITNPPFNIAADVIGKALKDVVNGGEVVMLLRLNFLGSQKRHDFWVSNPPKNIYVLSKRPCFFNGKSDSIEYAWFIWEKGYNGVTELKVV